MKEFLSLLMLPIIAVTYLAFGSKALIIVGLWALGLYIHGRIYAKNDDVKKKVAPFIRMNEEYALEKKCHYYFLPSLDTDFDQYLLSRFKINKNSIYIVPKNPEYHGTNIYPYISLMHPDIKFELKDSYRKFKFNSTKVDNILLKLNEYEVRRETTSAFKTKKELNLSHLQEGFGHIQQLSHRNLEKTKVSLVHKVTYILFSALILSFLFGLIIYYSRI
jgi:hypothetical protein